MDQSSIDKVCKTVYKRFPFLNGHRPCVSKQGEGNYLLLFSSFGNSPDGKLIQQTVRVVASEAGKIVKTSMSR